MIALGICCAIACNREPTPSANEQVAGSAKIEHEVVEKKRLPSDVDALLDPAFVSKLGEYARLSASCEQVYGIGTIYIAGAAAVGIPIDPLVELAALEKELLDSKFKTKDGEELNVCSKELMSVWQEVALGTLAKAFLAAGNLQMAREAVDRLAEIASSDVFLGEAAELFAQLGDAGRAVDTATRISETEQDTAQAKVAIILFERGESMAALSATEHIRAETLRSILAALESAKRGEWQEAKALFPVAPERFRDDLRDAFKRLLLSGTPSLDGARAILADDRKSPDPEIVAILAHGGAVKEALSYAGPTTESADTRLEVIAAIMPALVKERRPEIDGLVAAIPKLASQHRMTLLAMTALREAGRPADAETLLARVVEGSEKKSTFERFLTRTSLAGQFRENGNPDEAFRMLSGAKELAESQEVGRCNALTGLSNQYAALHRYAEALDTVRECTDGATALWQIYARGLALLEYARQMRPSFDVQFSRFDQFLVGSSFRLNIVSGAPIH